MTQEQKYLSPVDFHLATIDDLSSPTDVPLTEADRLRIQQEIAKKMGSATTTELLLSDLIVLKGGKDLITADYIFGETAGALIEPRPLQDPGAGEPYPSTGRKYSSTEVRLPFDLALRVKEISTELIPDDELSYDASGDGGREDRPHITVKYGIHDLFPDAVEKALQGIGPVTVTVGKISIFDTAPEYDVVKFDVASQALRRLNKIISAATEVTDTQKSYSPHITLAYVKKGFGKKYDGMITDLTGQQITFDRVWFCSRNGDETEIPLSEIKGGAGSGNFGHAGRPGEVGGSAPSGSPGHSDEGILGTAQFRAHLDEGLPSAVLGNEWVKGAAKFENMRAMGDKLVARAQTDAALKSQLETAADTSAYMTSYFMDNIFTRYTRDTPPQDKLTQGAYVLVHHIQSKWAGSASDNNATSLALQTAVANKFGLDKTAIDELAAKAHDSGADLRRMGLPDKSNSQTAFKDVQDIANSVAMKAYVDDVYNATQDWLKQHGINQMSIYRGMSWSSMTKAPQSFLVNNFSQKVSLNPLSSFSGALSIATDFANQGFGRVLTTTLPRERIFSIPRTGPGCLDEYEVIAIGGQINVHIASVSSALHNVGTEIIVPTQGAH